jgi:type VI protein secretion system component VasK
MMAQGFSKIIKQGTRRLIQPVANVIQGYQRDRRRDRAVGEASDLDYNGKPGEAAEVYAKLAAEELKSNELIYALYGRDAFKLWLKAKNIEKAMAQAREVLRVLSDAGWFKKSDDTVNNLSQMVGELYVAGYTAEADTFSKEINEALVAQGLAPMTGYDRIAGSPTTSKPGKLPAICPDCGGPLPDSGGQDEVKCLYCGSVIHAG